MKKGKVGVIGLTGQSTFLTVNRFPCPGETISGTSLFFEPGGKGHNQAIACARMGADTLFIGSVGEDEDGEICRRVLDQEGIRVCLFKKKEHTAFAAITTCENGENMVVVFGGAAKELQAGDLKNQSIRQELKNCSYLLLQNELSPRCLEASIEAAEMLGIPVIFNPAPATDCLSMFLARCQILTPNLGEAKRLAGFAEDEEISDQELHKFFLGKEVKNTIVTMGGEGVLLINKTGCTRIPPFSCGRVIDTTGAGDTFNGALAGALALGEPLLAALQIAVTAAGISVTRKGAAGSIPTKAEITEEVKNAGKA